MMTDAWPKAVRRMVDRTRAEGGIGSGVRVQLAGGEWEVFIAGERIRASAFFGAKAGGPKTKYLRGELLIDGVRQPLPVSFDELRDLWDEYELGIAAGGLAEVTDPGGERVPEAVRLLADTIRRSSGGRMEPRCGRVRRRWAVAVDLGPDTGLRILFEWDPEEREWNLAGRNPFQVYVDGEDRTAELGGDLDKAMALLATSRSYPTAGIPAPGVKTSPGARDNGVETRRMVVKRELPLPPERQFDFPLAT